MAKAKVPVKVEGAGLAGSTVAILNCSEWSNPFDGTNGLRAQWLKQVPCTSGQPRDFAKTVINTVFPLPSVPTIAMDGLFMAAQVVVSTGQSGHWPTSDCTSSSAVRAYQGLSG